MRDKHRAEQKYKLSARWLVGCGTSVRKHRKHTDSVIAAYTNKQTNMLATWLPSPLHPPPPPPLLLAITTAAAVQWFVCCCCVVRYVQG